MLLLGFAVGGYRSFGEQRINFGPLDKVTLLAGQNNSGKSNVLRVLCKYLRQDPPPLEELDEPRGRDSEPLGLRQRLSVAFELTDDELLRRLGSRVDLQAARTLVRATIYDRPSRDANVAWFDFMRSPEDRRWSYEPKWIEHLLAHGPGSSRLHQLSLDAAAVASGDPRSNLVQVLSQLSPLDELPPVKMVEAFRQISQSAEESDFTPDGSGLVRALAKLEQPGPTQRAQRRKFEAINVFLQTVLEDRSATLTVSRDPEMLMVDRGGRVLPLESLGTGVHQVVILAAVATLFEDTLLCIEEPEVHLHPLLQRKLGAYLSVNTTNQYVIATHSAHLFDLPRSTTYHLRYTPDGTEADRAGTPAQLSRICSDLGYRPSDLLQSNFVIWVEGPSDRVYVRRWLELQDRRLLEHVHYSIMFYGGRLLSHLSADDEEVSDFIRLHRLNRSMAIVMDSDRRNEGDGINATKSRVMAELAGDPSGMTWLTAGREIENYVPHELMAAAVGQVTTRSIDYAGGRYEQVIPVGGTPRVDKLKVAREVVVRWSNQTVGLHDLEATITSLAGRIAAANGMSTTPT